jgi:hypothetical protein
MILTTSYLQTQQGFNSKHSIGGNQNKAQGLNPKLCFGKY